MAELIDIDGLSSEIEVVTYLNSEDNKRQLAKYLYKLVEMNNKAM